mmetsp:Transcript_2663/g.5603  ORF Transcript_2663/g.5603 Transcript_2663/m.5603 type:complete len:179 (+) Transcript_2663:423-959(+)
MNSIPNANSSHNKAQNQYGSPHTSATVTASLLRLSPDVHCLSFHMSVIESTVFKQMAAATNAYMYAQGSAGRNHPASPKAAAIRIMDTTPNIFLTHKRDVNASRTAVPKRTRRGPLRVRRNRSSTPPIIAVPTYPALATKALLKSKKGAWMEVFASPLPSSYMYILLIEPPQSTAAIP